MYEFIETDVFSIYRMIWIEPLRQKKNKVKMKFHYSDEYDDNFDLTELERMFI